METLPVCAALWMLVWSLALFSLMGRSQNDKWVKTMLEKDLCGEISK